MPNFAFVLKTFCQFSFDVKIFFSSLNWNLIFYKASKTQLIHFLSFKTFMPHPKVIVTLPIWKKNRKILLPSLSNSFRIVTIVIINLLLQNQFIFVRNHVCSVPSRLLYMVPWLNLHTRESQKSMENCDFQHWFVNN